MFKLFRNSQLPMLWISVLVFVVDQWTKYLAVSLMEYGRFYPVFPHFNFTLAYNTGAAFSFLADAGGWQRYFFTAIATVVSLVIVVWLSRMKSHERLLAVALSLVMGGALGNVYDRIVHGHVVDFLDFYWGVYHFPAFNVADSAITLGAGLMILDMLLEKRRVPPSGSEGDSHD